MRAFLPGVEPPLLGDLDLEPYRALYVHIPFCASRCAYCDFTTRAALVDDPALDSHVEGIVRTLERAGSAGLLERVETVYVGGGTPTFLGPARLSLLMSALRRWANVGAEAVECTVEANPDSLDAARALMLAQAGATRLSIGVQSFDDSVLTALGRAHDAASAEGAVRTACGIFDDVSIDVMCGVPHLTRSSLIDTLERAVGLGASHVSVYPLAVERGTPLARAIEAGRETAPSDDEAAEHMQAAAEFLEHAGFARYEVASYAAPGHACRHNMAYWTGVPYLGLGPAAVSMAQSPDRRVRFRDGAVEEDLRACAKALEDVMLGMRMTRGVSDGLVARASACAPRLASALARLEELGLVAHANGRWCPTERGWLCGNEVFSCILAAQPDSL